ncbi:MAG: hypothetical protein JWN86_4390 [Planctomycetota bacterium]|nr:hypothetical protein [Planctomycetota bacterium]
MNDIFSRIGAGMEVLGGSRAWPEAQSAASRFAINVLWGTWWAVLLLAVLAFGGGNSKFVYIDF